MKTNNQPKLKNKIFIIWGLFISGVILVFLIILLLAINKPQPKIETINQQHLKSKTNPQQEQETYNAIMNKIEKEIDELTKPKQEPVSNVETNKQQEQETHNAIMNKIEKEIDELTSRTKVVSYHSDGITPSAQEIYDQTGNKIKYLMLDSDGESIQCIKEYNPQTGNKIKETYYNHDGTVKKVKNFK
ncbi:putative cop number controling protein (plasmid) [Candidatus Phytoplasma asteris]|uniref:Cop number controling protein n=1 Tax=Candidatus Phytoplasma asteris TaxID=85620 RepID=A0ABZ2YH89_9MOLU